MVFSSIKDLWLTITIWLFAIFFIVLPIFFPDLGVWMLPEFLAKQWVKIVTLFPFGFCLIWICLRTEYIIENHLLKIRYGPFKKDIRIAEIQSIKAIRNPFTAPALSMDRIEINYARFNTVAISPKNKTEFVRQLLKHNSDIKTYPNFEDISGS
ncbi:PH domain-containing protein [Bacillus sp. FJAT-49736]|uniref:PH domain-containing protein n=1 Tax=Bacillus sp. FJAT-49736 TaxID=2833582 RepID=UPI001BC94363|nr:PH domain-containing protein [Bacillus sp. FJAT-49736]MBS4172848.1 PH domain-containing protein [Bacillus sp. FJAT-49736]